MTNSHDNRLFRAARCVLAVWVFLLVLALDPFTADPAGPIKLLVSAIGAMLLTGLLGIAVLRGFALRVHPAWLLPVGFLLWHGVSAWLSPQPVHAIPVLLPWCIFLLVAFAASQIIEDAQQAWGLCRAVVLAVACASVYGFLQAAGLDPFPWSAKDIEEYRGLPATYANPNFAGHALVLAIPLAIGLAWRAGSAMRLAWLGVLVLLVAHLYLTHMRGGPVALVTAGLFLGLIMLRARAGVPPVRVAARSMLLVIPVVLVSLVAVLLMANRQSETPVPLDGSLVLRLNGYDGAARMALDHPATGIGAGRYAIETPRYWTGYEARWFANTGKWNHHAHNDLLETAAESGLPGMALYLAMLLTGLFAALRVAASNDAARKKLAWCLAFGIAAFAIDGLFGFNLRVPVSGGLFFLLWGIAVGLGAGKVGRSYALAAGIFVLSIATLLLAAKGYRGEQDYQWGLGGRDYLVAALEDGEGIHALDTDFDRIEARLQWAAKRMPWDAGPDTLRGQLHELRSDWDGAEAALKTALQRAPNDPDLLGRAARAAVSAAENATDAARWMALNRAELAALRALELAATLSPAHRTLGKIAELRAHNSENPEAWRSLAIRRYAIALQYSADTRAPLQLALGRLHGAKGDAAQAAEYLRQAAESAPRNPAVWDAFGEFAAASGDWQAYSAALHRALGNDALPLANVLDLSKRLGRVYAGPLGQPPLAYDILGTALRQAPYRIDLWAAPFAFLEETDRSDALEAIAAVVGQENDTWPDAVRFLLNAANADVGERRLMGGQLLMHAEALPEADATLAEALRLLPANRRAPALRLRSEVLAALGKPTAALALAAEAFQRDPNNVLTIMNYARRLAEAGKFSAADFQYASLRERVNPDTTMYDDILEEHAAVQEQLNGAS